jgi:hypothetical protein
LVYPVLSSRLVISGSKNLAKIATYPDPTFHNCHWIFSNLAITFFKRNFTADEEHNLCQSKNRHPRFLFKVVFAAFTKK